MKLVADLHIHSHYSRATSKNLTFEHLALWAQLKGIDVVGTGDIAHPGWLQEMKDRLVPAEDGLYRLKDDLAAAVQAQVPPACRGPVRFLLAGEISNIYKRDDQTRKVHNMVFAPDLAAVERLQARLDKIGNIRADGRPILGLDSRDLLEALLATDPRCALIPAHIWTPWFSLLGSKSGFDSVTACFGDLERHIFALETGLSSDPPMNWRVSALDRYTLVSNSDAHSPEKLGREATLFDTDLAYPALFDALKSGAAPAYQGTLEFFPEEGKYHWDGHRDCGIAWDPATTLAHRGLCPVCGKPVTVGVSHRVEVLSDRPPGSRPPHAGPFLSLVPLPEILGELRGVGAGSRQVEAEYMKLLGSLGPELTILREVPLEQLAAAGGPRLAAGIGRMRRGEIQATAGYDGEYGVIRVFSATPSQASAGQIGLFDALPGEQRRDQPAIRDAQREPVRPPADAWPQQESLFDLAPGAIAGADAQPPEVGPQPASPDLLEGLNAEQRAAATYTRGPLIIVAGPGTGKTRTLTVRIACLILQKGVSPETVLAITFTNKAAEEMAERLAGLLGPDLAGRITIRTFHAFCALLLRQYGGHLGLSPDFSLCDELDRQALLRRIRPKLRQAEVDAFLAQIAAAKDRLLLPAAPELDAELGAVYQDYQDALQAGASLDFDDLILQAVRLFETHAPVLAAVRGRYGWVSVDEYQDINYAQYRLLRLLAGSPESLPEPGAPKVDLCVIGDPDQAIYGFRGADRRYFLSFQADYPGSALLHLSQNYRSTQLILDAAVQVIGRKAPDAGGEEATRLHAAQVLADFADQVKLQVYHAPTDRAEAEYVVHQIEQMVGGTSYFSLDSGRVGGADSVAARSFADFAVLYRLGAQSRLLVEAFDRSGIPYQTAGETPLASQKIVREVLAHLWLLANPASQAHLETVLTGSKPDFSATALALVRQFADPGRGPLADALDRAAAAGRFSAGQRDRLGALAAFHRRLASIRDTLPVARLIEETGEFVASHRGESLAEDDREHLRQLTLRAAGYEARLADFLEALALGRDTDAYDPRADRVALLTLHAAKGLEFPVVFIVGCEEGLLPYERPNSPPDVEEERRLFYVGMTRARQRLVLTTARTRFLFGLRLECRPSRFVDDIEGSLKELQAAQRRSSRRVEDAQLNLF